MCKYCNVNSDDYDWIKKPVNLGDFGEHELDVSLSPGFEMMILELRPDNCDPIWRQDIKITYCPFCGRRLKKVGDTT